MNQEKLWERLHEVYSERGLILALGSGVSYACGLPTWEELLRRLARRTPGGDKERLYELMRGDGYSLPSIAGVIETFYGGEKEFNRAIKNELYKKFRYAAGVKPHERDAFIEDVKNCNATLASVASLCACKDGRNSFVPNPRIHAVINTNYDSVFRAYVQHRYRMARRNRLGGKYLIRTIERPSAGSLYGRIPVYYVHGFIRFDKDPEDYQKGAADLRVLTEQDFFNFFNNPNGLFNYTFLYLLREFPCLFVGMSLKDDNVRRLLHYSKKERVLSYAAEGRQGVAERKSVRHFAILKYPTAKKGADKKGSGAPEELAEATEISLRRLGVTPLWVKDYDELRKRLRDLYESTEPALSWADVF